MNDLRQRLRALSPTAVDIALAAALGLLFVAEAVAFGDWNRPLIALDLVLGLGTFGLFVLRRRRPVLPAVAVPAFIVIAGTIDSGLTEDLASPFLALIVSLYSLGRYGSGTASVLAVIWALGVTAVFTMFIDTYQTEPEQLLWLSVLGLGPYFIGRAMAGRTRLRSELEARTRELERDRATHAERAVDDERARIATELQAVVANGVTAMVLGAEAVPRLVAAGDVDRSARTLAVIEETGRDSLAEMRRLLGVLRRGDEGPSLAPLPTMGEVERLLAGEREDGLRVGFTIAGERPQLPPGADLAAYRVLEEALDWAAAAGGGAARVSVSFASESLELEVTDDRPGRAVEPAPLMAMRERLGLYGGRVRAAAVDGEGFVVRARLPLEEAS